MELNQENTDVNPLRLRQGFHVALYYHDEISCFWFSNVGFCSLIVETNGPIQFFIYFRALIVFPFSKSLYEQDRRFKENAFCFLAQIGYLTNHWFTLTNSHRLFLLVDNLFKNNMYYPR